MRDRIFIAAVALVSVLAIMVLVQNVRESTAPLYGPPTVDKKTVMSKVESGILSFKEASFYVREENDAKKSLDEDASGVSDTPGVSGGPGEGTGARQSGGIGAGGSGGSAGGSGGSAGESTGAGEGGASGESEREVR